MSRTYATQSKAEKEKQRFENKEEKKMILKFAIQTVFEIAVVVLIIYGFIHEDKLIAFEDSLKRRIKKKGAERHVRDSGNRS